MIAKSWSWICKGYLVRGSCVISHFAYLDKYTEQCSDIKSITVLSVFVLLGTRRMTMVQPVIITALFGVVMETNI